MSREEWILLVVSRFYEKAKTDVLIGYHFRVIDDFNSHLPRIATFWETILLGHTSRPVTHPFDVMNVHKRMGIHRGELGRWLVLFRKTLDEETPPEFAELRNLWLEKLAFFESVFLRSLGFQ